MPMAPRTSAISGTRCATISTMIAVLFCLLGTNVFGGDLAKGGSLAKQVQSLPVLKTQEAGPSTDWLIDNSSYKAGVYRTQHPSEIVLDNGLLRRTFRIAPNGATVGLDNLVTGQSILRGVKPEAVVTINGKRRSVGGLLGQPDYAYLLPEWLDKLKTNPNAFQLVGFEVSKPKERLKWKRVRHHAPDAVWPPHGVYLRMDYVMPGRREQSKRIKVSVHYELYDGIPCMSKWITVHNPTDKKITVNHFISETLAVVERTNWVETRPGVALPRPQMLHVETDFAFGGFNHPNANRHIVHWRTDPQFRTQVNYSRKQPCLLVVEPTFGPSQDIAPGKTFESCHAFELADDSSDRDRRGLSLKRMYRTVAPWVTENPLMMHMRTARPDAVRKAIDQCADVGFEMMILSFGSGFHLENENPKYLAQWKELADYAHKKGVDIGGYSLLSSRRVAQSETIICPKGMKMIHGRCPALTSQWGQDYFRKLHSFFEKTGFLALEHDGSYPGDVDVTARPPLQKGEQDSRWVQWRIISDYYKWCRERGIYLNVPDFYYLSGSSKCGMGYREVNWSLPRAQQVLHTRQNITVVARQR